MINNIFEQFGANVEVDEEDVMDMAADAAQTDLADDEDVRNLIRSVGAMVGREIDPEIEDKLTEIITSGEAPTDMASLMEMVM
ncbi:MAG: stage VI sporulation protein F [Defluviitaleaceae bacterium]|nr:stage VI sporulation protein F [Defluviitaleaceae bacterium]